mmetsp:Transcript_56142/g.67360  ORF Transcript_56142/g.67360 Transcript_56142/m.67360 type:complete len:91 (+) Transcript_56142:98-370(+)
MQLSKYKCEAFGSVLSKETLPIVFISPQNEARDHSVGDGNIGCKMFCLILQALRLEVLSGSALLHPTRVQLFLLFYLIVITANADTTQLR